MAEVPDAFGTPATPSNPGKSPRVLSTPTVTAMAASSTPRPRRTAGPGDLSPARGTTKVRVVCRLRPMNERENETGSTQAVTVSAGKREVAVERAVAGGTRRSTCHFHFDDVLEASSTQEDVFNTTVQPLIHQVLDGNEATVFAYGQTGTGKTYTMEGELDSDTERGLLPRAAAEIMRALEEGEYTDFSVAVSYLEIYNEEVNDLLTQGRIELKDGGASRGVSCPGLTEVHATSFKEILDVVRKAQEKRRVAGTAVNARSSRSHCIFTMKIKCKHEITRGDHCATIETTGKLHLVDLAGSEGAKKAATSGEEGGSLYRHSGSFSGSLQQLLETEERERRSINQSLLTLSRVITALRENSWRVPYRDSKLTRLLMDALGGTSRTVIIVTISPAAAAVEETISSLSYMENAAGIRNLRSLSSSSLRMIRPGELRADAGGTGAGSGVSDLAELESRLLLLEHHDAEVRESLERKRQECEDESHRADTAEERLAQAQKDLEDLRSDLFQAQSHLGELQPWAGVAGCPSSQSSSSRGHIPARTSPKLRPRSSSPGEAFTSLKQPTQAQGSHADAASLLRKSTENQVQILEGLITALRKGHRCAEGFWTTKSAEVQERLSLDHAATRAALDTVAESSQEAHAILGSCEKDLGELLNAGEAIRQKTTAIGDSLQDGQGKLASLSREALRSLEDAMSLAATAHETACARFGSEVQVLLRNLLESLQSGVAMAQESFCNIFALGKDAESQALTHSRKALLGAIQEASVQHQECHAQSVPVVNAMAELSTAIQALGSALPRLQELRTDVESAQESLLCEEDQSCQRVCDNIDSMGSKYNTVWESTLLLLRAVQDSLARHAADERQKNMVANIQAKAGQESVEVLREMSFCDETISATRDDISRELDSLSKLRQDEGKVVALLMEQRESLQQDVAAMQGQLDELREEAASCRARITRWGSSQQQAQEHAKDAIMSAITKELAKLNADLGVGIADTDAALGRVESMASKMRTSASATTEQSQHCSDNVIREATRVSQAIGSSYELLCDVQEKHSLVHDSVKAAAGHAHTLEAVEAACNDLSGAYTKGQLTVANAAEKLKTILDVEDAIVPDWSVLRHEVAEASKKWIQDSRRCRDSLGTFLVKHNEVSDRISDLCDEVASDHIRVAENIKVLVRSSDDHKRTLADLVEAGHVCDAQEERVTAQHGNLLVGIIKEASELSAQVKQASTDARSLREVIYHHHTETVRDWEVTDEAFHEAAASSRETPIMVDSVCSEARAAVTSLNDTHWGVVQEAGSRMASCVEASSSSYFAIHNEVLRYRNSIGASHHWFERCWSDAHHAWQEEAQLIKDATHRAESLVSGGELAVQRPDPACQGEGGRPTQALG